MSVWKPWYLYRPQQLLVRGALTWAPAKPGYRELTTAWGASLTADASKTIGYSVLSTGVHDLALSEAVTRLVDAGETVIDGGANVGYMTLLAAVAAGPTGSVLSFEPHPELFDVLRINVESGRRHFRIAAVECFNQALGARAGNAMLVVPDGFAQNDGLSRLALPEETAGERVATTVTTIDAVIGQRTVALMKLDVEGFELEVLRGAERALAEDRIGYVAFEDHAIDASAVRDYLQQAGFTLFGLGWTIRGPVVRPVDDGSVATPYEAPNFIATKRVDELTARLRRPGWSVLRRLAKPHRAA